MNFIHRNVGIPKVLDHNISEFIVRDSDEELCAKFRDDLDLEEEADILHIHVFRLTNVREAPPS
jgi:hypothetical protein